MAGGKVQIEAWGERCGPEADEKLGGEHAGAGRSKTVDEIWRQGKYVDGNRYNRIESPRACVCERRAEPAQGPESGRRAIRDPAHAMRWTATKDDLLHLRFERAVRMVDETHSADPGQRLVASKAS